MQARVGESFGSLAGVARGLGQTPVCGLAESSRDTFLECKNSRDGGPDWDSHKIGDGTH